MFMIAGTSKKLPIATIDPMTTSATCGKWSLGCNLPNEEKKTPSRAALNSTRELPSNPVKMVSSRIREELTGGFFLENLGYRSPYGFSFDKEMRAQGEARTIVSVSRNYTVAEIGRAS